MHYTNPNEKNKPIRDFITQTINPSLRLNLVSQPQRDEDGFAWSAPDINDRAYDVSYLEYQLLTQGGPAADSKALLTGWVQIGDFRKEFTKFEERKASASDFVLETF